MGPEGNSSRRNVVTYSLLAAILLVVAAVAAYWFYFYANKAVVPPTETPLTEADKAAILDALNSTTTPPQAVDESSPEYQAKVDILEALKPE